MNTKQNNTKEILTIALKLLIICSIVAVIIALVYTITKDKIAYNEMVKTADALSEIYSDDFGGKKFEVDGKQFIIKNNGNIVAKCSSVDFERIDEDKKEIIKTLYVLTDSNNASLGYCVSIEPMGFKDVIKMLVAIDSDLKIKGVKIITHSETSGYGSKAEKDPNPPAGKSGSDWFLKQFVGLNENGFAKNAKGKYESIDTISGATKTSQPVSEAIELALKQAVLYSEMSGGVANE